MSTERLKQMSRKEVRDYLRKHPSDDDAWDIFFEKIEDAPKREITSDEELIKIAKGDSD